MNDVRQRHVGDAGAAVMSNYFNPWAAGLQSHPQVEAAIAPQHRASVQPVLRSALVTGTAGDMATLAKNPHRNSA